MGKRINILFLFAFILLLSYIAYLCLNHLGTASIHNWDEARHGANAYEMLTKKNFWIHTYQYQVDYYNFKPPLSMWVIMLNYALFGFNSFAMRFGSALFTVFLCLVLGVFIKTVAGRMAALLFLLFFSFCEEMIFFHMARSGDADAVYMFFFGTGMAILFQAQKKGQDGRYFLYFCFGLCFSLAFMAKVFHAVLMLVIAFVYVVLVKRQNTLRELLRILSLMVSGFMPVLIWVIVRFRFDGTAFFIGMIKREVLDRISKENNYGGYIAYYLTLPAVWFMLAFLVIAGIAARLKKQKRSAAKLLGDASLLVVWLAVAVGAYSITGVFMPWYGYAGLIALVALISIICARLLQNIGYRPLIAGIWGLGLLAGSIYFLRQSQRQFVDVFFENNPDFKTNIQTVIKRFPEYTGSRIYIENSRNEYKKQDQWEQNLLLEARFAGHLQGVDGGVAAFLADPEGILILSKSLWTDYADILTGRVILLDGNNYVVFVNDFY